MKLRNQKKTLAAAAAAAGMDEKTARKYLKSGKLPSQMGRSRPWRTVTQLIFCNLPEKQVSP